MSREKMPTEELIGRHRKSNLVCRSHRDRPNDRSRRPCSYCCSTRVKPSCVLPLRYQNLALASNGVSRLDDLRRVNAIGHQRAINACSLLSKPRQLLRHGYHEAEQEKHYADPRHAQEVVHRSPFDRWISRHAQRKAEEDRASVQAQSTREEDTEKWERGTGQDGVEHAV